MYIEFYPLNGLLQLKDRRADLKKVVIDITNETKKSKLLVALDIIFSSFVYGSIYTEFEALDFIYRSGKNRRSFITVAWLLRYMVRKYNPKEYREIFLDKRQFNNKFREFVKRDTLNIDISKTEDIKNFIQNEDIVVIKKSNGCSGKQVKLIYVDKTNIQRTVLEIEESEFDMIEKYIKNCNEIAKLNPTSLNTMRIVTVHSDNVFQIFSACIRIGAIGEKVDNLSQGGCCADIDIKTGKISTKFHPNKFRQRENSQDGRDEIGLEIPYWKETIQMLKEAAKIVPKVHVIGWDVAITDTGPVLIEGNHSFHDVVMQLQIPHNQEGLKKKMKKALAQIDKDIKGK